jgi:hypothetical protein
MAKAFKILPKNYLDDFGEFEAWESGTTSLPSGWLAGTSGTYNAEIVNKKYGNYALGFIAGTAGSAIYRTIPDGSNYAGRTFKVGFWAKSVSTAPYLEFSDGVSVSTLHISLNNTYENLIISKKLDYAATQIKLSLVNPVYATTVYFDSGVLCEGEDLFTNLDTNIDISDWSPALGIKADEFQIANKEGSFIPEYQLQGRNIRVKGAVVGTDVVSCRTHFDSLLKSLLSWQRDEKRNLYLYDDRVLEVFLKSFDWQYVNSLNMIRFNSQFTSPDSVTRFIGNNVNKQVIAGTVTEFNFAYNGNADTKPVISFIADQGGAITTCALENLTSGELLSYTGTVPTNVALDIDCFKATVANSGIDKLSDFNGDFLRIVRGTKYFRFQGSNCTIKIKYFDRWL